jgi:hypothetical protein
MPSHDPHREEHNQKNVELFSLQDEYPIKLGNARKLRVI